jgi:hypothetical protein
VFLVIRDQGEPWGLEQLRTNVVPAVCVRVGQCGTEYEKTGLRMMYATDRKLDLSHAQKYVETAPRGKNRAADCWLGMSEIQIGALCVDRSEGVVLICFSRPAASSPACEAFF